MLGENGKRMIDVSLTESLAKGPVEAVYLLMASRISAGVMPSVRDRSSTLLAPLCGNGEKHTR